MELGPEWRPLTHIRELPGTPRGVAMTLGPSVMVGDLDEWLADHKGNLRTAVLLHEQEHSKAQLELGRALWLKRYFSSPLFAWDEEQRGWYLYLTFLRDHNVRVDLPQVAKSISSYSQLEVTEEGALAWCRSVWAGAWHPGERH